MNGHAAETNGESPVSLPSAKAIPINDAITLQPPLTRRGTGPGLLLLVPGSLDLNGHEKTLDPPPLQKWAEEGYAVAQIISDNDIKSSISKAIEELGNLQECESTSKIGLICRLKTSSVSSRSLMKGSVQLSLGQRASR
jgi:carboxymethylenebutenolidase